MSDHHFDDAIESFCDEFEEQWEGPDLRRIDQLVKSAAAQAIPATVIMPPLLAIEFDLLADEGLSLVPAIYINHFPAHEKLILACVGARVVRQLEAHLAEGQLVNVEAIAEDCGLALPDDSQLLDLLASEHRLRRQYSLGTREQEVAERFPKLYPFFESRLVDGGLIGRRKQPPEGRPSVSLEVKEGPHKGEQFVFTEHDSFVVGRGSKCGMILANDPYFSRYHFRIEVNPPQCHIVDLESRNGTFVNDQNVSKAALKYGDEVSAGQTAILVKVFGPDGSQALAGVDPSITWSHVETDPMASIHDILASRQPVGSASPPADDDRATEDSKSDSDHDTDRQTGNVSVPAELVEIPGYSIHSEIGGDTSRTVYRATDQDREQLVAIKLFHSDRIILEPVLRELNDDAAAYKAIDNRRVSRVLEVGRYLSHLYVASEYFDAVTPEVAWGHRSFEAKLKLATGVICFALEVVKEAHAKNIVHGNLNPNNVLIVKNSGRLGGRVTDFGLSLAMQKAGILGISQAKDANLSLTYLPPERLLQVRHATRSGDIYGLGATLYYFLSGNHPAQGINSVSSLASILNRGVTPLRILCPEVPEKLSQIVDRAMNQNPSQRFQSAQEMYQQLLPYCL